MNKLLTVWPFSLFFNQAPATAEQLEDLRRRNAAKRADYDPAEFLEIVKGDIDSFVAAGKYQEERLKIAKQLYSTAMNIFLAGDRWDRSLNEGDGGYTFAEIPTWLTQSQVWLYGVDFEDAKEVKRARKTPYGCLLLAAARLNGIFEEDRNRSASTLALARRLYEKALTIYLEGNQWRRNRHGEGYYSYDRVDDLVDRVENILDRNLAAAA